MSFSFGFAADDDDDDDQSHNNLPAASTTAVQVDQLQLPQEHSLEQLLTTLPERISYSTVKIESPTGRTIYLPRRELYDVRVQLLGEESAENDQIIDQLEQSDLRSGFYEGGFKTWECSLDLASLLLDRGPRKDIDELVRCDQIIELGAGTAIPSLVLFRHALLNALSLTFVLQDYNDAVLRLVTLPNLLLAWAANTENNDFPTPTFDESSHGDLEISQSLLQRFTADMKSRSINLIFLSGSWCPQLAALIPPSAPELGMVVLAAETIYSPESTRAFVELLVQLLQRVKMGKAMIGAKRVYFGVGGSIDGLKEACRERGAVAYEIENHGVPDMDGGVRRALVEVQMY